MKHFKDFLDVAAIWADKNDVPINIWRKHDDSWVLTMRFRDSEGWYSMLVPVTNVSVCGTETMAIELVTPRQARQAREARVKQLMNIKRLSSNQHAHSLPV